MNIYLDNLIKNNSVLLSLDNCPCCFGHLARGKILKNLYNNKLHLSLNRELLPEKKEYFPYEYIIGDYKFYLEYLKDNNVNIVIYDRSLNIELYNACSVYLKNNKNLQQYFLSPMNLRLNSIKNLSNINKILYPYPIEMKNEFKYNCKIPQVFIDYIYDFSSITEDSINFIKNKYNINNNKKNITVTVSTGKKDYTEKIFQRVYDVYKNVDNYNLIFIYGIYYNGKIFDNVNSSIFEKDILTLFSLSDIIVCQGSYNTLVECVKLNKNIICFPRHEKEIEEVERIRKYYNKIKIIKNTM